MESIANQYTQYFTNAYQQLSASNVDPHAPGPSGVAQPPVQPESAPTNSGTVGGTKRPLETSVADSSDNSKVSRPSVIASVNSEAMDVDHQNVAPTHSGSQAQNVTAGGSSGGGGAAVPP